MLSSVQALLILLTTVVAVERKPLPPVEPFELQLDEPPTWSVAADLHAGLGVLIAEEGTESFPTAGGLLRLRWGHVQIGGFAEDSILAFSYLEHVGGMLGVYLPFRHWVDVDAFGGFGVRTYANRDDKSYLGEYRIRIPAASLRLGVSDRAGALLGFRFGAQVATCLDLEPQGRRWYLAPTEGAPEGKSGVKEFGGVSVALLLTFGLDVAPVAEPKRPVRATDWR